MSPQELFNKLVTLSDGDSLPPKGVKDLVNFLELTTHEKIAQLENPLRELGLLGYIEIDRSSVTGEPVTIRFKKTIWDFSRRLEPEPVYQPPANQRRFAIFIDYKNLEDGIRNPGNRFQNFSWLLDPILKQGNIIFGFVFVPEHRTTRPAVVQLSNLHNFKIIVCPRQFEGHLSKDKDTVDAVMIDLGRDIIEHTDCTDLVVVGGDGDFTRLTNFAIWRRKKVQVFSTPEALSQDFRKLESEHLEVHIIES